ncbi:MAG: hypothetical protein RIR52_2628, partial [Acidobacteriota bacterium]
LMVNDSDAMKNSCRAGSGMVLALILLLMSGTACSGLVKVSVPTIPRMATPVASATYDKLLLRLEPFFELKSLRAWKAYLRFDDLDSAERYREAEAIVAVSRPDRIRLVISIPMVKTRIAEMVSENNRFKVAIYLTDYRRFLMGTNSSDYSAWRERLGERGRSALISARPFHFTDALLIRPLRRDDERFTYSIEEALVEGPDPDPKARRGARILRSHYVITEAERSTETGSASRVRRKFWFDRTADLSFTRQQIFDEQGMLQTEVSYSAYRQLNPSSQTLWPGTVEVSRPHDSYQARLTFTDGNFETNVALPGNAFQLDNTDNLPETDLDKPATSPGLSATGRARHSPARHLSAAWRSSGR